MFLRRAYAEWRVAVNYSGPDRGFNCERSDFSGAGIDRVAVVPPHNHNNSYSGKL
jgi:hypothetical protein